ncbi:MAG: hypothetical protein O7C98_03220 [Planctomycetota bacterium]|nr:hypothetical protein [Planctomycetota bacterium]
MKSRPKYRSSVLHRALLPQLRRGGDVPHDPAQPGIAEDPAELIVYAISGKTPRAKARALAPTL